MWNKEMTFGFLHFPLKPLLPGKISPFSVKTVPVTSDCKLRLSKRQLTNYHQLENQLQKADLLKIFLPE